MTRLIEGRHSGGKLVIPTRHGGHFFKADIPWIRAPSWGSTSGRTGRSRPPLPPIVDPKDPDDPGYGVNRFDGLGYRKALAKLQGAENAKVAAENAAHPEWARPRVPRIMGMTEEKRAAFRNTKHLPHQLTRYEGGFDTGYMTHAVFEAVESYDLESLAMRWTTCPRWGVDVERAKARIAKEMGIKLRDLGGYGDIPDEVILPYASYDADATLRLFWMLNYSRSVTEGEGSWTGTSTSARPASRHG